MPPSAFAEFAAIPRAKVYQEVARHIERRIVEQMKPGDLLPPERELAQMFGVSRSSVRDAIRSLESLGLVKPIQGTGTMVCDVSADTPATPLTNVLLQKRKNVGDLLEIRKIIEPPLARRAALNASVEQVAQLESTLHRQQEKITRGELAIEQDSEFHYQIALAAHNSVALKVVDVLMDLLLESRERSLQVDGRPQKSFAGHQRILAAIQRRDPAAAETAMRRHLQEIEKIVLKEI